MRTILGDETICGSCGFRLPEDHMYVRESKQMDAWLPVCDEFCLDDDELWHLRNEPTVTDLNEEVSSGGV